MVRLGEIFSWVQSFLDFPTGMSTLARDPGNRIAYMDCMTTFRPHAPAKRSLEAKVLAALSAFGVVPIVVILTILHSGSISVDAPAAFWMVCGVSLAMGIAARVVAKSIASSATEKATAVTSQGTHEFRVMSVPLDGVGGPLGRLRQPLQARPNFGKN